MPVAGLISTFPSIRGLKFHFVSYLSVKKPSNLRKRSLLTRVADMPGYPTRKLLFGGPETLTNAVILSRAH